MMLALRRTDGVAWPEIDVWLGFSAREFYAPELAELESGSWIAPPASGLRLTRKGVLLADRIMEKFF